MNYSFQSRTWQEMNERNVYVYSMVFTVNCSQCNLVWGETDTESRKVGHGDGVSLQTFSLSIPSNSNSNPISNSAQTSRLFHYILTVVKYWMLRLIPGFFDRCCGQIQCYAHQDEAHRVKRHSMQKAVTPHRAPSNLHKAWWRSSQLPGASSGAQKVFDTFAG